ncbi:hypothetical protein Q4E93_25465 [Flavitalea sp. BT771]|uniref:hypothetical protein n=1 Tax=Flavitalea sp. BT771 TaxID=3063329 RepID=UPI0026E1CD60|nr:hypothetical protein [Flavitalea sp. BT771]MDO6433982.1 hypothetical protein [Flavitalea sp. BT771]MDV6222882.1 hypothetical protein [Flavitalea sp. BT771]
MHISGNHLRKPVLVTFLWLPFILAKAQFNVAILPTGGIYLRSQLWNVSVSNTSTATVEATLHLDMKDIQTRQTVLSGQSAPFRVTPGVKKIQMSSIEPIVYNYGPGVVADRSANGTLPIGKYQLCYRLIWTYGENQTAAADDCDEIEVEPLSPPLLTMPENDSVVARSNPDFTWVPPAPLSMFGDLRYDLLISPVFEGQSITDAIQQNLPVQQAQGLQQPFFSYPLQGPQLEMGKRYAWQIIARDRAQYAVKSEVWTFRTGDKTALATAGSVVYLLMDSKTTGREMVEGDTLRLKYVAAAASSADLLLTTQDGKEMTRKTMSLRQGDNFLIIPLNRKFQSKHTYIAALQEPGGARAAVSFTIQ